MNTYVSHVKLSNITSGHADVRWFTPFPGVAFGFSRRLGFVARNVPGGRWVAHDTNGAPVGAFPSRKAAVDHLVAIGL